MGELSAKTDELANAAASKIGEPLQKAKREIENLDRWSRSMAREHPLAMVLGALVGGYVVGRIAARI